MEDMFYKCSSFKELDLSNFNTNNVTNMKSMFSECRSLKDLNIFNFITNNFKQMEYMFRGCSRNFQNEIKFHYPNIKEEAFNKN